MGSSGNKSWFPIYPYNPIPVGTLHSPVVHSSLHSAQQAMEEDGPTANAQRSQSPTPHPMTPRHRNAKPTCGGGSAITCSEKRRPQAPRRGEPSLSCPVCHHLQKRRAQRQRGSAVQASNVDGPRLHALTCSEPSSVTGQRAAEPSPACSSSPRTTRSSVESCK